MLRKVQGVSLVLLLGVGAGEAYAGLVGAAQLGVSGLWDRGLAFTCACVVAAGLFLLLVGVGSVLAGADTPDLSPPPVAGRSPAPAGSRPENRHPHRGGLRPDATSRGVVWKPRWRDGKWPPGQRF